MTPERWRRVEDLYHAALTCRESDRAAFLASACDGDEALRREVESLLQQHASNIGVLDGLAVTAAAQLTTQTGDSLLTGRRLGAYQVQQRIGSGGMGEVYRARDTKLGREVAIKVLPSHFTRDAERLARFEREARVLASLNHPHIGAIYELEEADGVRALVLELVHGETLADRIARGPIPVRDTLDIARQIADALEAAHEKGIVHRDLKPANIKITPEGVVKVLDFGLAKAALTDVTVEETQEGVILGTAAYMSPEQAKGRSADKRGDVWAFGVVLYEMLTGKQAFDGETISDVLAKVIEREPDWTRLQGSTPPSLRELMRRCLRKDPKARLQAIGDARVQIEETISGASEETAAAVAIQSRAQPGARYLTIVAGVSLLLAAALAIPAALYIRRVVPEPLVTRFEIPTPATTDPVSFALSADGRHLAFVATAEGVPRLWVRPLDRLTGQPLAGTDGASYPFWKPDGGAIGFFADGKLKRIDVADGRLQDLAAAPSGRGGTWNRDDVIVFTPDVAGGMMRVMAKGGTSVPVTHQSAGQPTHRWPQFLPDGQHLLFFVPYGRQETRGVYIGALDGGEPARILAADTAAVYAPPGLLLWVQEGVLVAQRFDSARYVVRDEPITVAQSVGFDVGVLRGAFAVSETGVLAHRTTQGQRRQLAWIDREGITRGTVGPPDMEGLGSPDLAPNGQRVAVHRNFRGNPDVWLLDTDSEQADRFTFNESNEGNPLWSPDGSRVVFRSLRNGLWDLFEKAATRDGNEHKLLQTKAHKSPLSWSPDGKVLLYVTQHPKTGLDLWALPMVGDRTPFPVVVEPFDETNGQISPNGRWVAYESNEGKQLQIYVRPFPGPGSQSQVTTGGGSQPRWSLDGKELFYIAADGRLMAAPISAGGKRGVAVPLFRPALASGANISGLMSKPQYAVARDGRFLMNVSVEEATARPITVVLNWDTALK